MLKKMSVALLFLLPGIVSAHEHAILQIGDGQYEVVVGSLHEPISVDDKTGVELRVKRCPSGGCHTADHMLRPGAVPVTGLEATIKVELIAGSKKKELSFKPTYGVPGAYEAQFYPTRATTYTYRIFGEIAGVGIDIPFTCKAEGETRPGSETEVELSDGVTQLSRSGGFGCPTDKKLLGFPDEGTSFLKTTASTAAAQMMSVGAILLSILSIVLVFWFRRS